MTWLLRFFWILAAVIAIFAVLLAWASFDAYTATVNYRLDYLDGEVRALLNDDPMQNGTAPTPIQYEQDVKG